MSVEGAISEWLRDDPRIIEIVGTDDNGKVRVFPTGTIPQDLRPPWVSFQRIDADYCTHLGGVGSLTEVRLQINAVGRTATQASELGEIVRLRACDSRLRGQTIDGTKIEGVYTLPGSDRESEAPPVASRERATMARIIDYGIWHRVEVPA